MPIKKDEDGNRWVEMNLIVDGTPEEVWQAMATGPGNTAWFTKTEIEEHVGGKVQFDFGSGMASTGEVTTWEPPFKFGYVEREWEEGAPPVATEIVITTRKGGKCSVRMVHSLFTSKEDWDDQLEGFESGWPGFFEVLRQYLAHFAGKNAASFQIMLSANCGALEAWQRLTEKLHLRGADVGERRTLPAELEAPAGVVEQVAQGANVRTLLLRMEEPQPGIALVGTYADADKVRASVSYFLYGENAAELATRKQTLWSDWMNDLFPSGD